VFFLLELPFFVTLVTDKWKPSDITVLMNRFNTYSGTSKFLDKRAFVSLFDDLGGLPLAVTNSASLPFLSLHYYWIGLMQFELTLRFLRFRLFDCDKNGKVDFREFCFAVSVCSFSDRERKVLS
jgi:hypothetical protein